MCEHSLGIISRWNKPGEDIKLKVGDIIVTGQVYGRLQSHRLQPRADRMDFIECQSEQFPGDNRSLAEADPPEVSGVTFSNSEGITTKQPSRENCLELT